VDDGTAASRFRKGHHPERMVAFSISSALSDNLQSVDVCNGQTRRIREHDKLKFVGRGSLPDIL
jgi:hypothetical protein